MFRVQSQTCLAVLVALVVAATPAAADIDMPAVFGSHMVLQQNSTAPFWGHATPGEKIEIRAGWLERILVAFADKDGNWRIDLRTPAASGPFTITVSGKNRIVFENVLIGEVWVCSGQSNMEWVLNNTTNAKEEIPNATDDQIRMFDVANAISSSPLSDCTGTWKVCAPEVARQYSAVAYHFAKNLRRELGVPVGLICTSWGGTPAQSWTRAEALRPLEDFNKALDVVAASNSSGPENFGRQYRQKLAQWRKKTMAADHGSSGWHTTKFDHSKWKAMQLPRLWRGTEIAGLDGAVWYRRSFEIPEDWAKKDCVIELGPIDDQDITWVNGRRIGGMQGTTDWNKPRHYTVPASALRKGRNVIAIRVLDTGGAGGFNGTPAQMRVHPKGDASTPVSLAGPWNYSLGLNLRDAPPMPAQTQFNSHTPSVLYNGMIAPLIPFGIRGAIWYQGESNRNQPKQYGRLFPAMITNWREDWGQGDFPFLFVQIAPFNYGAGRVSAELREAQFDTLGNTPNTGMAVTMDIGNARDIHPRNKKDVGLRLALWALAGTYEKSDVVCSGPVYTSHSVEGNSIRLKFDHVGSGLSSRDGGALTDFTIAGEDRKFVPAMATITGNSIVVHTDQVSSPVAVRFAWTDGPKPNFCNKEGLPASSFRTDRWEN